MGKEKAEKRLWKIHRKKKSVSDRIFDAFNAVIMVTICVFIAYPLYYVIIASVTDPAVVGSGRLLLYPVKFFAGGYERVMRHKPIWTGYLNTIYYTVCGTVISVSVTLSCAFALSRKTLPGRRILSFLFTFTMFFGGGIIPLYLVITKLRIYNTIWAIVLPSAVSVYNLIVCRSFFESNIPDELYDASRIDGCNDFDFYFRVAIPLSKAIIVVMILFFATSIWNSYMNALMFLGSQEKMPLQVVLRGLVLVNEANTLAGEGTDVADRLKMADQLKYSIITVSALPLLIVYPFIQKHFAKGVLMGAVKG